MDANERLALIERVNHSSGEQAKRTLNFMILKCTVAQPTIARAIRAAIEQHAPTPTIVYEQPESEHDDESAPSSPRKRSKKKKNQHGSSQDEEDVPASTSKKRRSTRRGDINPDSLVGQLILKKSKSKSSKPSKKRSRDHNEEQNNPNSSKKHQSKHASKLSTETEQRACGISMERPSEPNTPTVIDLVTSSDDKTSNTDQSENESLDDKSSDDNSSENDNSDGFSSDSDSSDDGGAEEESQGNTLADGLGPSQDGSNKRANEIIASSDDDGRGAARSITVSMAKASIQNDGIKMSSFDLSKKRKAPEHAAEDVHNDRTARTATDTQANKRAKRNQPGEPQTSLQSRTCRDCGVLFPSKGQLLRHRLYCKGAIATPIAGTPADYNFAGEAGDFPQLRVHLNGGTPTAQPLLAPRRGSDTVPTNDRMDTNQSPFVPANGDSKAKAPSSDLSLLNASPVGGEPSPYPAPPSQPEPHNMNFVEKLQSLLQATHKCRRCFMFYDYNHNEAGDCQKGHSGLYRKRFGNGIPQSAFRDGKPPDNYSTWSCCGQQGRNAPACDAGKAVRHMFKGKVNMNDYQRNARLRRYMGQFL